MADEYRVSATDMTELADVIRAKGGTADALVWPDGFISAVDAIQTGESVPENVDLYFNTDGWATKVGYFVGEYDDSYDEPVYSARFETLNVDAGFYTISVADGSIFIVGTQNDGDGYITTDHEYLGKVGTADVFRVHGGYGSIEDNYY